MVSNLSPQKNTFPEINIIESEMVVKQTKICNLDSSVPSSFYNPRRVAD